MNEITLPPSPNWYLYNVFACSKRGTVAWGGKNYIVIVKRKQGSDMIQYSLLKDFAKNKISSLAFCPKIKNPDGSDCPELLICGGDDDRVKIWNVDTLDVVVEFNLYNYKSTVGVDWSANDNVACVLSSENSLVYCNIQYKTMKKTHLGKFVPTCLACCPHDENLVAIGAKTGLIYIVQKETILYRMRGHDKEVVSLSWCPSEINVLTGEDKRDLLLASGAKDRHVYIWRAGRDGRYETMITLPHQPVNSAGHQVRSKFVADSWITICWAEPKMLVTSSIYGEVLTWDLSRYKVHTKLASQLFHAHHSSRCIFCIVNVPRDTDNWRTNSELAIWTIAQDRWVMCCRKRINDPDAPTVVEYKIPTQGGYVYCMEACPVDTSRIAFGVGDMMLRLWNSSEPHITTFDITIHWQKIMGKIRAISWMPNEESVIAFGTGEGRVGVFEAIGTNKPPVLFRQYHRDTVYKLEWAQIGADYLLFSCAEGELVAYKKSAPQNEPMSIIRENCTEFSWKSNLCLAVALQNGSITFYDQKLRKRSSTIHILKKVVNCLAWHPESTAMDEWTSSFSNYLAVASDSHSIVIFDMSELIKELKASIDISEDEENEMNDPNDKQEDLKFHKIVATLEGHSDRVVCLAWSPHVSGLLVSGSYDNVAQVWNVETQEVLGTFTGHDAPVLSCMWSPLKPQLIITGSVDFTLRVWDYTSLAQAPIRLKCTKKKYNKQQKSQKKAVKNEAGNSETCNNATTGSVMEQATNSNDITEVIKEVADSQSVSVPLVDPSTQKSLKKKSKKYFIKYNSLLNNNSSLLELLRSEIRNNQEQNKPDNVKISLFSEQTEFLKYLTLESSDHYAHGNTNTAAEMDLWHGNLQENLMAAVKDYRLNDFLVSLAPTLSIKMWREMCEAYAQQLIMEGNVERAVSYFLCIHKTHEAIQTFVDAKMYQAAYVLARCKLCPEDPILETVLRSWMKAVIANGQLEQAAHCYIQLGEFGKAAETLASRKNVECLELASELAFLNGDERYGTFLATNAMTQALVKSDWTKARSLISQFRKNQYLNVYIDAHETLISTYRKESEVDVIRTWLKGNTEPGALQTLAEKHDVSYNETLKNNDDVAVKNKTDITMMHLNISYQVAIAATCETREAQLCRVAKILNDVFEWEKSLECTLLVTEIAGFFSHVFTRLDTKGPMEESSIYAKSDYPVSQSVRAYLCIGLLKWLLNYMEELSSEEETQLTQIVLDLLDDAVNETTLTYQKTVSDYRKLEDLQIALLSGMPDDETDVNNDKDKDNLDKIKKKTLIDEIERERICIPNPMDVFHTACLVANKLREDNNRYHLICYLDKLANAEEIKLSEIEENALKKLEELSPKSCKIDADVVQGCSDEVGS